MSFTFEKLLVYQKAVDFADAVCTRTEAFPRGYGFLVDQLNRAALSVSANIAEGNDRFTLQLHNIRHMHLKSHWIRSSNRVLCVCR